ncbi:MAG: hypothetical protein IJ449_06135 [Clostridia bacterium]|nr:hypothetical protein [Clostridia bacterium]
MTTVKRRFLLSAVILAVILITVILTVTVVVPNVKEQQLAALRTSAADAYTAGNILRQKRIIWRFWNGYRGTVML